MRLGLHHYKACTNIWRHDTQDQVRINVQLWILIVLSLVPIKPIVRAYSMSRILGKLTYGLILKQNLHYPNKLIE